MAGATETSDVMVLDLLRKSGSQSISELAAAMAVTPTAVRQRLNRLMGAGMIEREVAKASRGRPSHRYLLTEKGRRQTGANFVDLALVLWNEIRAIKEPEIRRGLLQRLAGQLATMYRPQVQGAGVAERMQEVTEIMAERNVPFEVEQHESLPVLNVLACPYPQLAEQDRGICSLEKMLFSELLGTGVRLTHCRLDGDTCCRFETN